RARLDPIYQLDALSGASSRKFAFVAKTQAAARAWQKRARAALAKTLGFLDQRHVSLAPRIVERVDRGDHLRQKVILRTSQSSLMPVYVLIPKPHGGAERSAAPRLPCVLALAGHGYGV